MSQSHSWSLPMAPCSPGLFQVVGARPGLGLGRGSPGGGPACGSSQGWGPCLCRCFDDPLHGAPSSLASWPSRTFLPTACAEAGGRLWGGAVRERETAPPAAQLPVDPWAAVLASWWEPGGASTRSLGYLPSSSPGPSRVPRAGGVSYPRASQGHQWGVLAHCSALHLRYARGSGAEGQGTPAGGRTRAGLSPWVPRAWL